jgi:hypothetical protein
VVDEVLSAMRPGFCGHEEKWGLSVDPGAARPSPRLIATLVRENYRGRRREDENQLR